MNRTEILAALRELGDLHQTGVLSAEEFQRQKDHLLVLMRGLSGGGNASPTPPPPGADAFQTGGSRPANEPSALTPAQLKHLRLLPSTPGDTRSFQALSEAVFVWCPPGTFRIGSDDTDEEAYDDEKPARDVTLTQGFWMKQTPVTQAEWQALTGFNPSHFKGAGPKAPVEQVSWFEAVWFCNLLSKKEGLPPAYRWNEEKGKPGQGGFELQGIELVAGSPGYRLPTEAEWEYACRAGTLTPRYGALNDVAWWGAWEGKGNAQVTYQGGVEINGKSWGTHPVGQKQPNAWGLYDMLGNVWEWCFDVYKDSYAGLPTSNPLHTSGGAERVKRGGSWDDNARSVRSADRDWYDPTIRDYYLGFRLLRY